MDVTTQSSLMAAIVGLALGIAMLLRAHRARVLTRYGALAISLVSTRLASTSCVQTRRCDCVSVL